MFFPVYEIVVTGPDACMPPRSVNATSNSHRRNELKANGGKRAAMASNHITTVIPYKTGVATNTRHLPSRGGLERTPLRDSIDDT